MSALEKANRAIRRQRNARYAIQKRLARLRGHPRLVSEGDSWFLHPIEFDVIDWLTTLPHLLPICSNEGAGDELVDMCAGRHDLAKRVEREGAAVLLLSAGGNDMVGGGGLKTIVRDYQPSFGANYDRMIHKFKQSQLTAQIKRQIVDIHRVVQARQPDIQTIFHGYDYPDVGNRYLGIFEWGLDETLDDKNVPRHLRHGLMKRIVNDFNESLAKIRARGMRYLDLRGTLARNDWVDEMHPGSMGYRKLADKFAKAIEEALASP